MVSALGLIILGPIVAQAFLECAEDRKRDAENEIKRNNEEGLIKKAAQTYSASIFQWWDYFPDSVATKLGNRVIVSSDLAVDRAKRIVRIGSLKSGFEYFLTCDSISFVEIEKRVDSLEFAVVADLNATSRFSVLNDELQRDTAYSYSGTLLEVVY
jgi:hypothetical protein